MKTISLFFFLIVLSVAVGCKRTLSENKGTLPVLDMEATIGKQAPDTFTWNSVAKKITYVPMSPFREKGII